ncbi:MAG: hypothetical protein J6K75_08940, partial [Erysipelotrichaceae bacterium]|nr:hypothetical protein [Erysipelotrichaceae bacterium]
MAIFLKEKTAKKIAEAWTQASIVAGKCSTAYDFEDVKSVVITNTLPVELNDYVRSGTNRYGNPTEVQDEEQRVEMTQDKAFSATIDKGNRKEQNAGLKNA